MASGVAQEIIDDLFSLLSVGHEVSTSVLDVFVLHIVKSDSDLIVCASELLNDIHLLLLGSLLES